MTDVTPDPTDEWDGESDDGFRPFDPEVDTLPEPKQEPCS